MLNDQIFFFFYNLAYQSAIFDGLIFFLARYFQYLVIFLAIFFLLFHQEVFRKEEPAKEIIQKLKESFFILLSVVVAWLSAIFLKIVFKVPRPFLSLSNINPMLTPADFAFPSGHSAFFMGLAVAIFMYHKKVGILFIVFALFIGVSRVIAGVHYPFDIIGGWLFGGLISYLLIKIFKKK